MYQFFIGSNNQTHSVDYEIIKQVLSDYEISGATIIKAFGLWENVSEDSVIVQVEGISASSAKTLLNAFKVRLNQISVGLQRLPEVQFL